MSTPTVLPADLLARLAPGPPPDAASFVRPALVRAALYLTPVLLATAAAEPLGVVPWPVPVAATVLVWCVGQPLTYLGHRAAGRSGTPAAARLVLAGFAAVAVVWSGLLAAVPAESVGGDRRLAYAVSLPATALLAAITAALVTRSEAAVLRWSAPAAAVAVAWLAGVPGASGLRVGWALLAGIGLMLARASVPAWRRGTGPAHVTGAELAHACGHLWLGIGQAAAVVGLWRIGYDLAPASAALAAVTPLLVAVPLVELWIGWHLTAGVAGLSAYEDRGRYLRHLRRLGWLTLAVPLGPLLAGVALAATAQRLPYGLSDHPAARGVVLMMAGGVLLAGVVAVGLLLSARRRPGLAAVVTAAPVVGTLTLHLGVPDLAAPSLSGWGALAPAVVIALAVAYAAGLVLAAHIVFDPRSYP